MRFLVVFWMLVIVTFACFYCSTVRADVAYFDMGTMDLTCTDERGKKIPVVENYEAENYLDEARASWDRQNQRRMIYISDTIKQNRTKNEVALIAYHECAHHQLNHDLWRLRMWSDQDIKEEQEADCASAVIFFKNHGVEAYEQLLIDIERSGLMSSQRLAALKECR
jgi:hypothetical protein